MSPEPVYSVQIHTSMDEIPAGLWDAYANPDENTYNPFVSHNFLKALEVSRSVGMDAGWLPVHLSLKDEDDKALGFAPCYLKLHSRGEFVFDHGWAQAYAQMGKRYYPKLQMAVPFTPVAGPKLLVAPGKGAEHCRKLLVSGAVQVLEQQDASSLHITFLNEKERLLLDDMGMLLRTDHQFHWENQGFDSFDEFLGTLSSRKRKALKKERREALVNDIEIDWVTGSDLTEAHWDDFFRFYMDTGSRKWGTPYLTREFFSILNETMQDDVLLIMCKRGGRAIAGALNFIGGDCLYGRYWGCVEHHKFLHFEICYYQAIDFAIAHKLKRVEAGAQGEHKLARGYLPVTTWSAHYIADPYLRGAVANFLEEERDYVDREGRALSEMGPYANKVPE